MESCTNIIINKKQVICANKTTKVFLVPLSLLTSIYVCKRSMLDVHGHDAKINFLTMYIINKHT